MVIGFPLFQSLHVSQHQIINQSTAFTDLPGEKKEQKKESLLTLEQTCPCSCLPSVGVVCRLLLLTDQLVGKLKLKFTVCFRYPISNVWVIVFR